MGFCCFKLPKVDLTLQPPPRTRTRSPEPPVRPLQVHKMRRRITGGSEATPSAQKEQPYQQQQSKFIERIPPELRLICWEYTLGSDPDGDVIHLESVDGVLRHCRCFETDRTKLSFRHICWKTVWRKKDLDEGNWYAREPYVGRRLLISLLLTCKLFYREAIDIMYRSNTFSLHRAESIIRMPQMMLPHRFQLLRSIQFSTVFLCPILPDKPCERSGKPPENASKWRAACKVLASLEHLDNLEVTMAIWSRTPTQRGGADDDSVVVALEPLKEVSATNFSVILTEPLTDDVRRRLGPIPFIVSKRVRPGIGYYNTEEDD